MKITFTVVLLGLNFIGFTQSIAKFEIGGKIYSAINGKELSDATVWVDPDPGYGVPSDSTGTFNFTSLSTGSYRLEVERFAYERLDTVITVSDSSITNLKLWLTAKCDFNKESALEDIRKKKPKLLLIGGDAPIVYITQKKFERKFNVKYYDFGCLVEAKECITEYNQIVFEHLDRKYGQLWRKSVRNDVIGLNY